VKSSISWSAEFVVRCVERNTADEPLSREPSIVRTAEGRVAAQRERLVWLEKEAFTLRLELGL
jgi:hypothetical protein